MCLAYICFAEKNYLREKNKLNILLAEFDSFNKHENITMVTSVDHVRGNKVITRETG